MVAFLKAEKEGFPIKLDTKCEVFQTMAFADPNEFEVVTTFVGIENTLAGIPQPLYLKNKMTKTIPAILHFNGLTDMSILKELK
jgi:hypothetical protein